MIAGMPDTAVQAPLRQAAAGFELDDGGLSTLAPAVTLRDVELCAEGTWNAVHPGRPVEITRAQLESCVLAAADPEVDHAAIRLGHTDERPGFAAGDGEPAIGYAQPTRVELRPLRDRNGQPMVDSAGQPRRRWTLIGDLVDVPAKLAAVIPRAYRRRSIEALFNRTTSSRTYPAAMRGLALLGVDTPAVKGLSDVLALYSEVPAVPPAGTAPAVGELVYVTVDDLSDPAPAADPITTGTTGGTVPRSAVTDERLRELAQEAADSFRDRLLAELRDEDTADAPTDGPVAPAEPVEPAAPVAPEPVAEPAPAPTAAAAPAPAAPAPQLVAASEATPGLVQLSQGQYDQLVQTNGQVAELMAERDRERRDQIVAVAFGEGRITAGEQETFRAQLDVNEPTTVALLGALQPGRMPTSTVGYAANLSAAAGLGEDAMEAAFDGFRRQTFPELAVQPTGN